MLVRSKALVLLIPRVLSSKLDIPYVITTDAHYLKKEDREIHEAFLKSDDNGDSREVGEFYNTTYMMSEEEIHSYMDEYLTPEPHRPSY